MGLLKLIVVIARKGKPLGWHVEVLINTPLLDAKPVRKLRVH